MADTAKYAMLAVALLIPAVWALGSLALKGAAQECFGQMLTADSFRKLITLPAYLLKRFKYEAKFSYDRKINIHIIEFYGKTDSDLRFLLHQANKAAYMLLALEFCLLIGFSSKADAGYYIFCAMALGATFILPDSRLNSKIKKRSLEIMLDFPDFLVKLTLLINAGMNISKAWEKVTEGADKSRALGRELDMALLEIRSGKSESKAYEDFAKRCRIQEVTRVVSVLLQNVKKGNAELVSILRVHANECWEMRKNAAKKLGEEASSKMLLPMVIMLMSILLIVTTPAVLALQGIV